MNSILRPAIVLLVAFTLLTGLAYPLVVTGLAQVLFPSQANGSLLTDNGRTVGSALIGQPFDDARYFWGRPSGTAPGPYNAAASTGSNLGPLNPALEVAVKERVASLHAANPTHAAEAVPVDLVTASASGLDPHVSPDGALMQAARVAASRGLDVTAIERLVRAHIEPRTLGILGEPRVNVLRLNLALDALAKSPAGG